MFERLQTRLTSLRDEFAKGEKRLREIEAEATDLRQTLLRISGAIQVLTEELGKSADAEGGGKPEGE